MVKKLVTCLLAVTMPLSVLTGCSQTKQTTTVTQQDSYGTTSEGSTAGPRSVTTETTTTTEKSPEHSGGLFSIVGDIIALPFRALGALLSAIF